MIDQKRGGMSREGSPGPAMDNASHASSADIEKHISTENRGTKLAHVQTDDNTVTLKTWLVVWTMAFSYGISFWPVPFFSTIQSEIVVSFGSAAAEGTW